MTREEWLEGLTDALRLDFDRAGFPLPDRVRVSCGWPGGARGGKKVIGECWPNQAASDQVSQVFISPALEDVPTVAHVLVHELIHAAVGCEAGHKGPFKKAARAMGLEGKLTATVAGAELAETLLRRSADLGPYPHAALNRSMRKKQATRMLKLVCPGCEYTVRTTQKWLDVGVPTCCCGESMRADGAADDDA